MTLSALGRLVTSMFFLAGCADGASLPAGWRLAPESGSLVHADSRFAFPPSWNGMMRNSPAAFDSDGLNVSVGYQGTQNALTFTIYVYPRGYGGIPDPEEHFKAAVGAVVQGTPGARLARAGRGELPLGNAPSNGFNAFLHWSEPAVDAGSFLVLIPDGSRFFKLRATFELDQDGDAIGTAWETVLDFLRSLRREPDA